MLEFRPHHFLCTVGFEGKGYSPAFIEGYARIVAKLRGAHGNETLIRVTEATDSICAPCPSRQDLLCASQAKIESLDRAHARVLGLKAGEMITWGEAKARIREKMTDEAFESSCAPCSWMALGICKAALQRLKEEANEEEKPAS